MSKVTLETLKADFERLAAEEWSLGSDFLRWLRLRYIERECHKPIKRAYWQSPSKELVAAARLYRIARKQGLNAAMLWKLQNA